MTKRDVIKNIEKQFEDVPEFISVKFLADKVGLSRSCINKRVRNRLFDKFN